MMAVSKPELVFLNGHCERAVLTLSNDHLPLVAVHLP